MTSIDINFTSLNNLYQNKKIQLGNLMVDNKVNEIPHGYLLIMADSNYNFLNVIINITIGPVVFKFYVESYETYHYDKDPKFPYGIQLQLYHHLYLLKTEFHCRTWNNLSNSDVTKILLNNCKIPNYQWNLPLNKPPIFIQYNESNWDLFQRVLSRNEGFFYYNGQLNITKNLILKNNLNQKTIEQKIWTHYDDNINVINYDNQKINQCSQQKAIITNIIKGQYNKDFFEHCLYEHPRSSWISSDLSLSIGDYWQENIIVGNQYHINFQENNESINKNFLNDPYDFPQGAYNKVFTTGKQTSLFKKIIPSTPSLLTAFVHKIQNKYYNEGGKILIKFPWDLNPQGQEVLSNGCWVPHSQWLAGSDYGSWTVPQPGQEVIVGFLNNNIDEPCVLGSLYNKLNTPPSFTGQEISIKTPENSIIIDDQQKHITMDGKNNLNVNLNGSYNFAMKGDNKQSYNITLDNGNVNIAINNGNYNFKINGDVNFNIAGNLNFSVDKNINMKCQNFTMENTKTQWSDQQHDIDTKSYSLKTTSASLESTSYANKNTTYDNSSTTTSIKTTALTLSSTQMDIKGKISTIDSPLLTMTGNIVTVKGTVTTIKGDSMIMLQSSVLVQIMAGLFNVLPTITFVIRGPIGNVGSVPPLLA